ncbi:MAG: hypothetical protein JNM39_07410 [Bdellovibrionaceae bacterium]|nr:hypothetical protein [Pseudobdellovibrionaceae bacterium]
MNLDKLFAWAIGIAIAFAVIGRLDDLQTWVWKTQAKLIYQSRTKTWGSPRFFPDNKTEVQVKIKANVAK